MDTEPVRAPHPFLPKAHIFVNVASQRAPEILPDLQAWLENGECGGWHGIDDCNTPGDLLIMVEGPKVVLDNMSRETLDMKVTGGFTFEREQPRPTGFIMLKMVPGFQDGSFQWSSPDQVKSAGDALVKLSKLGQKIQRALVAACKAADISYR